MYFTDRTEAAIQLLPLVKKYSGPTTVVLAIPRGGVPIGCILATSLGASLDLLMSKKIGAPYNPEYAIGAVGIEGELIEETEGIPPEYIQQEMVTIRQQLQERYHRFWGDRKPLSLHQKTILITDDGIATGRTILAAIPIIRKQAPKAIVVAVPVCSLQARQRLLPLVNELLSCYYPDPFIGVGRFYTNFGQVEDEEVIALLREFR
jgi:putative phosphoribosyl transferase